MSKAKLTPLFPLVVQQSITDFTEWVEQEKQKFFALCLRQESPKAFFQEQIFSFYANLCNEGREQVSEKYLDQLKSDKQRELNLRLQTITETALDDLGERFGLTT